MGITRHVHITNRVVLILVFEFIFQFNSWASMLGSCVESLMIESSLNNIITSHTHMKSRTAY
jgi:hypothetical protein